MSRASYNWLEDNQKNRNFRSFEEEIDYMNQLGYRLVPAEYYIPHWSEKMRRQGTESEVPKLYVLRIDNSVEEVTTSFDCYAAAVAYPLYFKKQNSPSATTEGSCKPDQSGSHSEGNHPDGTKLQLTSPEA